MTEPDLEKMQAELQQKMGTRLEITADRFFTFLNIHPADLLILMKELRDNYKFNYLANITSVDYGEKFAVVYHLYSLPENHKIAVKTYIDRSLAEIDSVFSVWPTADWQEREVYDLMGIKFKGHPNLIRVLLPDDFEGHPLRKDFDMKGVKKC